MNDAEKIARFRSRTYQAMFKILVIALTLGVIAIFLGRYLDTTFEMRPYGSVIAFFSSFGLTWVLIYRIYVKSSKDIKEMENFINNKDKKANVSSK